MNEIYTKIMEFKRKYPGGIAFRVKAHSNVASEYLNPGEEVLYAFCGQKNESFTEILNSYAIVVTNKRLLLGHKRLLWGSFYTSITPDLYNDMEVYKGLFWGKITIDTVKEEVVITNLPKKCLSEVETIVTEFMMQEKKKYKDYEKEK